MTPALHSHRLAGLNAVVTGAGSGIGRATAQRFVAEGARTYFADRNEEAARQAADECDNASLATSVAIDISSEDSVEALFERVTRDVDHLDVVVANAGVQLFGRDTLVADLDLATWQETMDINLTGTFLTLKHGVRALQARGGSLIVTGSPTGIIGSAEAFTAYGTSKAGIHGLVRLVAASYADRGIRANTVIPGFTETPLVRTLSADEHARSALVASAPLQRAGTPEDVTGIMVYLASAESSFATGAMFTVDGGVTAV